MTDGKPTEEEDLNTQYQMWKKTVPLMYTFMTETKMVWPSLTFDWCGYREDETTGLSHHRALAGTYTNGEAPDKILLMETVIPLDISTLRKPSPDGKSLDMRFKTIKEWSHDGEANKIKSCGDLMASINGEGTVFVRSIKDSVDVAPIVLKEHTTNAFGLDWSVPKGGAENPKTLVSGGEDGKVIVWDLESQKPSWQVTTTSVNDVQCHKFFPYILGVALEEGFVALYDTRADKGTGPTLTRPPACDKPFPVNCVAFSPHSEYLFAAGTAENTVSLFDIRNTRYQLHTLCGHEKAVTGIEFDPFHDNILGSCSEDRRVIVWNMNSFGCEEEEGDADDPSPDLFFMHGGHTATVSAFAFNPDLEWCLGSVSDDRIAQVWGVGEQIYAPVHMEVEGGQLE
ncbi:Histone acetyltransferase type B subunit 2 [Yarrowia sp. C11]|nr:Histone acetyltransferase type B subunit 2 [Yarrowia sp. C11]